MTLGVQELSDRFELQELVSAYTYALDTKDWDRFRSLFTDDATVDYSEMGGAAGPIDEVVRFLAETMPIMASTQHLVGRSDLTIDGDEATGRTICFNPMVLDLDGRSHTFFCGLWYRDRFRRTEDGWKFSERYEERSFFHNTPPGFPDPGAPPAEGVS